MGFANELISTMQISACQLASPVSGAVSESRGLAGRPLRRRRCRGGRGGRAAGAVASPDLANAGPQWRWVESRVTPKRVAGKWTHGLTPAVIGRFNIDPFPDGVQLLVMPVFIFIPS